MKIYNKLVRDKILGIIEESGKNPKYRALGQEAHKQALKAKLIEEAVEFAKAETHDEMVEELADVYEVLSAIYFVFDFPESRVFEKKIAKQNEKGGFLMGYFLESVEDA